MSRGVRIYLIDGSSYIYRAFFAIRDLKTSQGVPTNAVYGFTTMLTKVIREMDPKYLAVILDAKGPTFRHMAYEHYKANRPEMPEDMRPQIPWIKEIVTAHRIPMLEMEGYEADDIIGTMARKSQELGHEVVIISGDKDLFQLVTPQVTVLDTMFDRTFDVAQVRERYGTDPERLPDVFGLMGDTSDNIPGVPGIGEKRAKILIQRFGSLEELLRRADEVPEKKTRESLLKYADLARLSKQLATIETNVSMDVDLETLEYGPPDVARLRELFRELEFRSLLQEWTQPHESRDEKYHTVDTWDTFAEMTKGIEASDAICIHVMMSSPDPMSAELLGMALGFKPSEAYYIPAKPPHDGRSDLSRDEILEALRPFLEDPEIGKIGHDLKPAMVILRRHGIGLEGIQADAMVASYLINPSQRSHGLETLALEYLDRKLTPLKERLGKGNGRGGLEGLPLPEATRYACEDVDTALRLTQLLVPKLKEEGFDALFNGLEIPLIPVLVRMEMNGVRVDVQLLEALSAKLQQRSCSLEEEIHQLAGEAFNINSPQQLGTILFDKLKLPVVRKTKTGYSTDMEVLRELAKGHVLPGKVLEYRSLVKLRSTYVEALPRLVHPETGRIHTSFNQTVTATGRLSSSEPNLQNIPIRSEIGQQIRRAFVPEEDCWLFSADYSQVELRILAHLSQDPILMEAFHRDGDIHLRTAAEIFGVAPEEVTPQMRREAKVINFGIIYGMSAFGLSRELDVEPKVARAYIEGYFQRYKGVRDFIDGVLEKAKENGYVETLMNRKRYLPEITSSNAAARKFAERTAINTPIQGTAADLIKKAMIRIQDRIDAQGLASKMLIQVHDELLFEVPEREREVMAALVREEMESVERLTVPLRVDTGWGKNWAEAHSS